MDALAVAYCLQDNETKENFRHGYYSQSTRPYHQCPHVWLFGVWVLIATVWAVGASWHCSSVQGIEFVSKLGYAFFSALFPNTYLLLRYFNVFKCSASLF